MVRAFPARMLRDDQDDEIAFSPDGELLAIGDMNGAIQIWNVTDLFDEGTQPTPVRTFQATNPVGSLAFSPDGTKLAFVTSKKDETSVSTPNGTTRDAISTRSRAAR